MDAPGNFAIAGPLAVAAVIVLCAVMTHALSLQTIIHFVRRERRVGFAGVKFWRDVLIVAAAAWILIAAHLLEIAMWACGMELCGAFAEFVPAFYFSAGNYTTLGAGSTLIAPWWRLLGPLEAANGMLMFGVSTAIIFAVVQRLVRSRIGDID